MKRYGREKCVEREGGKQEGERGVERKVRGDRGGR